MEIKLKENANFEAFLLVDPATGVIIRKASNDAEWLLLGLDIIGGSLAAQTKDYFKPLFQQRYPKVFSRVLDKLDELVTSGVLTYDATSDNYKPADVKATKVSLGTNLTCVIEGEFYTLTCPEYHLIQKDGSKLMQTMGENKGKPATSTSIQFFCFASENPQDLYNREYKRIQSQHAFIVKREADDLADDEPSNNEVNQPQQPATTPARPGRNR